MLEFYGESMLLEDKGLAWQSTRSVKEDQGTRRNSYTLTTKNSSLLLSINLAQCPPKIRSGNCGVH